MTTYLIQVTEYDETTYPAIINCADELTKDFVAFACGVSETAIDHICIIARDERAWELWDKYEQLKSLALELRQAGFGGLKRNLFR